VIYIRMELWPKGDKSRAQLLGEARIANSGTGTRLRGTYTYEIKGRAGMPLRRGALADFPRKQLLGWDLLTRVLALAFGERNGL
jgi:hypothetical protein